MLSVVGQRGANGRCRVQGWRAAIIIAVKGLLILSWKTLFAELVVADYDCLGSTFMGGIAPRVSVLTNDVTAEWRFELPSWGRVMTDAEAGVVANVT